MPTRRDLPLNDIYLDAPAAAKLLNVSLSTLYTYVSRKNIRTSRRAGSRESWYLRSDIEMLKLGSARGDRQSTPGLASSTAITLLADGETYYRGRRAADLAKSFTLEQVAQLLWAVDDTDPFAGPWPDLDPGSRALWKASRRLGEIDRLMAMIPAMEAANPRAHDLTKGSFCRSGADFVLQAAAIELDQAGRATSPIHAYIGSVTGCGPAIQEAVRTVLVLSADLALEPATYAVRAAANTGASPYKCMAAGLSAAGGKRLPAVRTGLFSRFIREIQTAKASTDPIVARIRENEPLPGFGFSPFATADGRAICLLRTLRELLRRDRDFERFDEALRFGQELSGLHPEFAFLAAYVSLRLGGDYHPVLVRLGRFVGWIAHAFEQQAEAPLIRWRVNYKGPLPA